MKQNRIFADGMSALRVNADETSVLPVSALRFRKFVVLVAMVLAATTSWAQSGLHKVNWRDARITDVGARTARPRPLHQERPHVQG